MTLTITDRDKKLLCGLAGVLVIAGIAVLGIKPMVHANRDFAERIELMEDELYQKQAKAAGLPAVQMENDNLIKELSDIHGKLMPMMKSSGVDQLFTNMILQRGLSIRKLEITMPEGSSSIPAFGQKDDGSGAAAATEETAVSTDPNADEKAAAAAAAAKAKAASYGSIFIANVHLEVTGDRNQLEGLLDELTNDYTAIRVTSLQRSKTKLPGSPGTLLEGDGMSIDLQLYMYIADEAQAAENAAALESAAAQ